jgi:hypothetical protein
MAEHYLVLTDEEREYLANLLNSALSETRVEVHRTHTPAYRERVLHEEDLIRGLLAKLPPTEAPMSSSPSDEVGPP